MSYLTFRFMLRDFRLPMKVYDKIQAFNSSRIPFYIEKNRYGQDCVCINDNLRDRISYHAVTSYALSVEEWEHQVRGFISKDGVYIYTGSSFSPIRPRQLEESILCELGQICNIKFDLDSCNIYTGFQFPDITEDSSDKKILNFLTENLGNLWEPSERLFTCNHIWGLNEYGDSTKFISLASIALTTSDTTCLGSIVSYDYIKDYMSLKGAFPDNIYFPPNPSALFVLPSKHLSPVYQSYFNVVPGQEVFLIDSILDISDLSVQDLTMQPMFLVQTSNSFIYNCKSRSYRILSQGFEDEISLDSFCYGHKFEKYLESAKFNMEAFLKYQGIKDSDIKSIMTKYQGRTINTRSKFRVISQKAQESLEALGYTWKLSQNLVPSIKNVRFLPCNPEELQINPCITRDGTYALLDANNGELFYFDNAHKLCKSTSSSPLCREIRLSNGDNLQYKSTSPVFLGVSSKNVLRDLQYNCTLEEFIGYAKQHTSTEIAWLRTHLYHALLLYAEPSTVLASKADGSGTQHYFVFDSNMILRSQSTLKDCKYSWFSYPRLVMHYTPFRNAFIASLEVGMTLDDILCLVETTIPAAFSSGESLEALLPLPTLDDTIARLFGKETISYNKDPASTRTAVFDYIDVDINLIGFMPKEETLQFVQKNKKKVLTYVLNIIAANKTFVHRGYPITAFEFASVKIDWVYKIFHVTLKFKPEIEEVKEQFAPPSEYLKKPTSSKTKHYATN